ncbi:MAG: YetF domain-containing protein [Thermoleophilia bacterium]
MDIVLRAAVAYVFIVFLMRVVGRRELSSMEPSDLILLVVMGDLIQNGVTQSDYSVTGVVLATSTFGLLAVLTSYLVFRSRRAKSIIEGEPVILVQNGEAIDRNLKGERLTLDDVMEEARAQQLDSLDQVKWAVLESNGSISIIPKQ